MYLAVENALALLDVAKLVIGPKDHQQLVKADVGPVDVENNLQYLIVADLVDVGFEPLHEAVNDFVLCVDHHLPMTQYQGQIINGQLFYVLLLYQLSKLPSYLVHDTT